MRSTLSTVFLFATSVLAHMQLNYPPTFGAANNPHRTDPADDELQFPYGCCGKTVPFPCRGYLKLLGTPQGASVASWEAGSQQNFNLTGIGNHYGGSCQIGFSVDNGTTFQVATSYEGNCPHRTGGEAASGQNFNFTVPSDIPIGNAVFAWTWFNREQEFNMNCAAITVTPAITIQPLAPHGVSSSIAPSSSDHPIGRRLVRHERTAAPKALTGRDGTTVPYKQRPAFLIADTDNGCKTVKTTSEVKYPHPGPEVVLGDGMYPLALPTPAERCGY